VRIVAAWPRAGPQSLRAMARLPGRLAVQAVDERLAVLDCRRPARVTTRSRCSCARTRRQCRQHTPKFPLLKERSFQRRHFPTVLRRCAQQRTAIGFQLESHKIKRLVSAGSNCERIFEAGRLSGRRAGAPNHNGVVLMGTRNSISQAVAEATQTAHPHNNGELPSKKLCEYSPALLAHFADPQHCLRASLCTLCETTLETSALPAARRTANPRSAAPPYRVKRGLPHRR